MEDITPEMVQYAAERLRALADESRIRLMMRLRRGEAKVSDLSAGLGIAQPSVSKHLAILRQAGIVKVRHEGAQSYYAVRDESVFGICDIVCTGVRRFHAEIQQALSAAPPKSISDERKTRQ